jgi:2-polyprenyl-6-methoxyphenol hydroxylase-like FAD-dependent oxidoreductase
MLPIGGVGINCAIADVVEATDGFVEPLRGGSVEDSQLAEVHRGHERRTRLVQRCQDAQRERVIRALGSGEPFCFPPRGQKLLSLRR